MVCVPILFDDPDEALAAAVAARDAGADIVEFRVDQYFTGAADEAEEQTRRIIDLVTRSPLPSIATCRPVLEGGQYDGPDDARVSLFERLGTAAPRKDATGRAVNEVPPTYVDVELSTYQRSANIKQKVNLGVDHPGQVRSVTTGLILSSHDFLSRPADLFRRLAAMNGEPVCRVVKVAFRARSVRDNLELLELIDEARERGKPMIALGMGEFGLLSRVLAPKVGAFLTFAALRPSAATAPGQPTVRELLELYRFRSIGPGTGVYGVVGWPVGHSISPAVHNAGFEAVGHDGVYVPLPVPAEFEHLKASVLALADSAILDLRGLSVTIPHKESLVRLAQEERIEGDGRWTVDELSAVCGSGNTLVVKRDSRGRAERLEVRNTDGPAVVAVLREAIGLDSMHDGAANAEGDGRTEAADAGRPSARAAWPGPVLVLGAGGTARAAAAALAMDGAAVWVLNRTPERAAALADELTAALSARRAAGTVRVWLAGEGAGAAGGDQPPMSAFAAVFNATPLGLRGSSRERESALSEAGLAALGPACVVADAVYAPRRTPMLAAAAARGLRTVDGLAMFVHQAAGQFEAWTGRTAPRGLMRRVAEETVG